MKQIKPYRSIISLQGHDHKVTSDQYTFDQDLKYRTTKFRQDTPLPLYNSYESFKTSVLPKAKRQQYNSWSWLSTKHKHINHNSNRSLGSKVIKTSNPNNAATLLKHSQVLLHKQKNFWRLTKRNERSRMKIAKYSRIYETGTNTQYAMTFQKPLTPAPFSNESFSTITHKTTKQSLALLLKHQHVLRASTHVMKTQTNCWFTTYKLIQTQHNAPSLATPSNLSLIAYTNSITELSESSNSLSLQNTLGFDKNESMVLPNPEKSDSTIFSKQPISAYTTLTKPKQSSYNLPLLNCWMLESRFVRPRGVASKSAVFILAKAPTYRMSITSEAPISTSQHYGNLYNQYSSIYQTPQNLVVNTALRNAITPLLTKSVTSASITSFLKPHKNSLQNDTLRSISSKLKNNSLRTLSGIYQSLLYVPSAIAYPLVTTQAANSKLANKPYPGLYHAVNLKNKAITRRPFKKNPQNAVTTFHKSVFTEDIRLIAKNKKNLLTKALQATHKKINRFVKWKTKKSTFFFTKFRKLNKTRKSSANMLSKPNHLFNKSNKYRSSSLLHMRGLVKLSQQLIKNSIPSTHGNSVQLNINVPYKLGTNFTSTSLTHNQTLWLLLLNPFTLKNILFTTNTSTIHKTLASLLQNGTRECSPIFLTNLVPHDSFRKHFSKKVLNSFANRLFREDIIPYYQNTLIRFIEYCTGRKVLFQFYPFVNQHIDKSSMVRYKRWLPRMNFYERRLGHKFFLEEALHIMHISFVLRDPKIIASWLKAIILRISFWKTRSIFRFLKYLFHNYFTYVFEDMKIKGLKIRLKGKISSAGNSRKRTILYRVGRTSHSEVNLRVVKDFSLINTFTGVMGFQVYLFY